MSRQAEAEMKRKAAREQSQIERRGDTITMADGVTTIKAIVDTQPEATRAAAPQEILDQAGRATLGLFYITAEGYAAYMNNEGQTLTRKGAKWTVAGPVRNESFTDVSLVYVLLAYTGGNPA